MNKADLNITLISDFAKKKVDFIDLTKNIFLYILHMMT